jgi:hypothetical protein
MNMIVRRCAIMMMRMPVVIVVMRRRRHPQTHLVRPKFPVQVQALRRSPEAVDQKCNCRFDQDIPANVASMLTTPGDPVKPPMGARFGWPVFALAPIVWRVRSSRFPEPALGSFVQLARTSVGSFVVFFPPDVGTRSLCFRNPLWVRSAHFRPWPIVGPLGSFGRFVGGRGL